MPSAIPILEDLDPALRDQRAVMAVLGGDTLSYRELVERYQRLVYAVTWSRLGDVALAEDAAQEAFIRAYRSLPLLGNGAKFSAWVTAIARNTAHTLGLKQRKELEKRERWAVEQPEFEPAAAMADEMCPPELLRQTLAELTDEHRESLVLFYLDGKSGAEAAAALGISEAALRMRLMRARAALRERLEARLGESLRRLQPTHSLVPGVMGAIATSSTAKAGGATVGTTLLAALGKVLPFTAAVLLANLVTAISASGLFWWIARLERRNYREPEGFRAQIHRDLARRGMVWFWLLLGAMLSVALLMFDVLGLETALGLMGVALLPIFVVSVRFLQINRGKLGVCRFISSFVICGGCIALGLGLLPPYGFGLVAMGMFITFIPVVCLEPSPRMDRSLFLRERMGMLKNSAEIAPPLRAGERFAPAQMMAFAQFLGERLLVIDFQWADGRDGLLLRLHPVKPQPSINADLGIAYCPRWQWRYCSWIRLASDGSVSAHCSSLDEPYLRKLAGAATFEIAETEKNVAAATAAAWMSFHEGKPTLAAQRIGDVSETEIFRVPYARSTMTRVMKGVIVMAALVFTLGAGFVFWWDLVQEYNQRGYAKFQQGDYAGALADYAKALEFDPRDATAYHIRALVEERSGDDAGAIANYTKTLEIDPKYATVYYNRGENYYGSGNYPAALADFDRYIELVPKDTDGFTNRGDTRLALGDRAGAIADYTRAAELDPKNASAFKNRGVVKQINGDLAGSLDDYDQAIKAKPDDSPLSRLYRQLLLLDKGNAPTDFASSVAGWSNGFAKSLGQFVAGQLDETALLADAAKCSVKTTTGQQCEAYYFIGRMRQVKGDQATARDFFQKCVATGEKTWDTYQFAAAELARLDGPVAKTP